MSRGLYHPGAGPFSIEATHRVLAESGGIPGVFYPERSVCHAVAPVTARPNPIVLPKSWGPGRTFV